MGPEEVVDLHGNDAADCWAKKIALEEGPTKEEIEDRDRLLFGDKLLVE